MQPADRVTIDDLGFDDDNIAHVTARFGFQEEPNVPQAPRLVNDKGLECDIDVEGATYFLSRTTIRVTDAVGMAGWRKRLFALSHNAANPIDYFGLPPERTTLLRFFASPLLRFFVVEGEAHLFTTDCGAVHEVPASTK